MPERVQLSRAKGWRMPPNTVNVARPTRWGNPFAVYRTAWRGESEYPIRCATPAEAVERFRTMLMRATPEARERDYLSPLRGKNLACWCKPDDPCHADVLLALANAVHETPAI